MKKGETKSLLVLAGQRSLSLPTSSKHEKSDKSTFDSKKLMMKLTMPRLRKMQALVRGFLTRRIIYPQALQQYTIAKSVLNTILMNVVYRECSSIIMQQLAYNKYPPSYQQLVGEQPQLEQLLVNNLIQRVMEPHLKEVIEKAVNEHARLLSQPRITYGFNIRDPLELLMYSTVNKCVQKELNGIIGECIQEEAQHIREERVLITWITKHKMLQPLLEEVVEETLNEHIADYVVDHLLQKTSSEAAEVLSQHVYYQQLHTQYEQNSSQLQDKIMEWMLQQGIMEGIKQLGHNM